MSTPWAAPVSGLAEVPDHGDPTPVPAEVEALITVLEGPEVVRQRLEDGIPVARTTERSRARPRTS
jgi:hypothetical protein